MSANSRQSKSSVKELQERAQLALGDAVALIEQGGSPEGIASRSWSAMYYAMLAALRSDGYAGSGAEAVLEAFEKVLARTKGGDAAHGNAAREARRLSIAAEAEDGARVTNDGAFASYNAAVELVAAAEGLASNA